LAAALLLTIALGLGSNVTVLAFINGLTVKKSGLTADERVVSVFARDAYRGVGPLSYDDYVRLRQSGGVEWLGAARVSRRSMKVGDRVRDESFLVPDLIDIGSPERCAQVGPRAGLTVARNFSGGLRRCRGATPQFHRL